MFNTKFNSTAKQFGQWAIRLFSPDHPGLLQDQPCFLWYFVGLCLGQGLDVLRYQYEVVRLTENTRSNRTNIFTTTYLHVLDIDAAWL
jgi:hypothetical protein